MRILWGKNWLRKKLKFREKVKDGKKHIWSLWMSGKQHILHWINEQFEYYRFDYHNFWRKEYAIVERKDKVSIAKQSKVE
jgi:hypothetical protein